jgi:hypothetical protein
MLGFPGMGAGALSSGAFANRRSESAISQPVEPRTLIRRNFRWMNTSVVVTGTRREPGHRAASTSMWRARTIPDLCGLYRREISNWVRLSQFLRSAKNRRVAGFCLQRKSSLPGAAVFCLASRLGAPRIAQPVAKRRSRAEPGYSIRLPANLRGESALNFISIR